MRKKGFVILDAGGAGVFVLVCFLFFVRGPSWNNCFCILRCVMYVFLCLVWWFVIVWKML